MAGCWQAPPPHREVRFSSGRAVQDMLFAFTWNDTVAGDEAALQGLRPVPLDRLIFGALDVDYGGTQTWVAR
jgi:hypothetical protein